MPLLKEARMMTPDELAEYLGVPLRTLYAWRYRGEGPRGYKIGKHIRYRQSDIKVWLEEQASGDRPVVSHG